MGRLLRADAVVHTGAASMRRKMLTRLSRHAYATVAKLLTGFDHQLSVAAVLAGAMPGDVFVDDPVRPSAVFVHSPEGNFVGGDPADVRLIAGLREHLAATIMPERDEDLVLSFDHDGWPPAAQVIMPDLDVFAVPRRHYVHRKPRPQPNPPPGYRIAPIDATLLQHRQVPSHLRNWMGSNWGSEDAFLAHGFGAAALRGEDLASWSLADCIVADRAEIGIHTAPEHRRRGLATQVAAAAVAIAFDRGLTEVGWHCNDDNVGSYRTAESVGFTLQRRYRIFGYRVPAHRH
ncbi:GNAT family N-acetyltransferase [Actinopolymorpha sp. NPDC004070]|uniref:GNAT family N-acetyltransferase n=1 Tax=Actinopolymorpha sp. NPDC004070 TaxID=3154548 RepID=UPI0033AD44A9